MVPGHPAPILVAIGGLLLTYGENYFGSTGQLFLYTGIAIIVVGVVGYLLMAGDSTPPKTSGGPIAGMVPNRFTITCAPQKDMLPHGST